MVSGKDDIAGNVRAVSSLQGLLQYQQLEVTNLKHRNRANTSESSKYQAAFEALSYQRQHVVPLPEGRSKL